VEITDAVAASVARTSLKSGKAQQLLTKSLITSGEVAGVAHVSPATALSWLRRDSTPQGKAAARLGRLLMELEQVHGVPR
jgi:hypothetical protein